MKKRKPKEFWERHFVDFERQKITQSRYCKENNLNANYFSRLLARYKTSKTTTTPLVEIKKKSFLKIRKLYLGTSKEVKELKQQKFYTHNKLFLLWV